jgi:murein DD-endopeptidase MepM/ murein hydrolase activator NlpD
MDNVAASTPRDGFKVLPPRSETQLLAVGKALPNAQMSFEYEFQFLPGEPGAEHRPDGPYRLPYALASTIRVSQAFPEMATHTDPSSQHAIDFVMPVGTNVFAARAGVVIDVAGDFFENGTSVAVDGPRANLVRVLHDDGTMSIYGHLNWNSIRVVPGQRVARGEYLADSGNTGFSTGPHLHFVVQRNRGGAIVSVPIEFAGAGGASVTLRSGNRYAAY